MLLKHYWVDRSDLNVFALTQAQYNAPLFGTVAPSIPGLEIVHRLSDENDVPFCLSTCPDDATIPTAEGISVLTQDEWDAEISTFDARQEAKRFDIVRTYRDKALAETDWLVIKAQETGTNLSTEFKTWRQALRDLPEATPFPITLPASPDGVTVSVTEEEYQGALRAVQMVNDPVPAPPQEDLGIE
jgi:nitrogen fixation protein